MSTRLLRGAGLMTMAALAASLAIAGPVSAKPAGNNGTVKIDGRPFDSHPDNEPHVGCAFQVDFYGFDEGAGLYADVSFEAKAPSGSGPVDFSGDPSVFIGGNDIPGASESALDASETYTIDVTGLTEHPNQGFHIKLTIHADGAQGADTKHKTFWVTGCEPCEDPPNEDPPNEDPPNEDPSEF